MSSGMTVSFLRDVSIWHHLHCPRDGKAMNRTAYYSEEISQTALALLALIAAGKSLDASTVQLLRSLLTAKSVSRESRVNLTIFSDLDDEEAGTELPVIIPFAECRKNINRYHDGYGTLSLKNRMPTHRENHSRLRVFSPDVTDDTEEDDAYCLAATTQALRIYAE